MPSSTTASSRPSFPVLLIITHSSVTAIQPVMVYRRPVYFVSLFAVCSPSCPCEKLLIAYCVTRKTCWMKELSKRLRGTDRWEGGIGKRLVGSQDERSSRTWSVRRNRAKAGLPTDRILLRSRWTRASGRPSEPVVGVTVTSPSPASSKTLRITNRACMWACQGKEAMCSRY